MAASHKDRFEGARTAHAWNVRGAIWMDHTPGATLGT
jgi:hypothetical protein